MRLLRITAASLRVLATSARQVPTSLITAHTATKVSVNVARADGSNRAFWKHVGMHEEEEDTPRREPWSVGWREVITVLRSPHQSLPSTVSITA
jgi:hypothetical protein